MPATDDAAVDESGPPRRYLLSHSAAESVDQTPAEDPPVSSNARAEQPSLAQSPGRPEPADADAGWEDDGWVPA